MDKVKLALLLISIAITIGPICTALLIYRDNLLGLIIPSELPDLIDELMEERPNVTLAGPPQYDPLSRRITVTLSVDNPYGFDLTFNSLSAGINCTEHHIELGKANSDPNQKIPAESSANITIIFEWTQIGEDHIRSLHSGQSKIQVDLIDIKVDVQGVEFQLPSLMTVEVPTQ